MKYLKHILVPVFFFAFSNAIFCQAGDTMLIQKEAKKLEVLPYLSLVVDKDDRADIKAILPIFESGAFEPIRSPHAFSAGFNRAHFWFRLVLKNKSLNTVNLVLNTASIIDTIVVYRKQDNEDVLKIAETGIDFPYASRLIPNRNFLVPISVKPGSTVTCFLMVKNGISTTYIPFSLTSEKRHAIKENAIYLTLGIFCGLFFFVIIFNLCFYLFVKEKIHIIYALYVLSSLVFLLIEYGLAFEYGLKYLTGLRGLLNEDLWWLITLSLWLYVMQLVLDQKRSGSRFYKITKWIIITALIRIVTLVILFNFFRGFYVAIYDALSVVDVAIFFSGFIVLFGGIIERIYQKFTPAIVYLLANSFGAIGAFYLFSNSIGLTNFAPVFPNVMTVGLTIEIVILTVALSYRYYNLKKEKINLGLKLERQQNEFSKLLIQGQEDERKRIAEDLHDEIGSNLAAIKLNLISTAGDQKEKLLTMLDKASADVRRISHNLMPPEFEKTALITLLDNYYRQLGTNDNLHIAFYTSGETTRLDKKDELMIYRIIIELTNNIIKHANATEATVQLIYYDTYLGIMIEDNGTGLKQDQSDGIGLKNVYSRVGYLKGSVNMDNSDNGTTIMITLPYKEILNAKEN